MSGQGGRDDMERLLDLFLDQEVELPYDGGFESAVVSDDDESVEKSDSLGEHHYDAAEIRLRHMGRQLADMGDEFLHQRSLPSTAELKKQIQEAGEKGDKEKAYSTFKRVMSAATEGTPESEAYKVLGAVLMTLHGLNLVGQGAKGLAKAYTRRFMEESKLDEEIRRIGGLEKLQQEVD